MTLVSLLTHARTMASTASASSPKSRQASLEPLTPSQPARVSLVQRDRQLMLSPSFSEATSPILLALAIFFHHHNIFDQRRRSLNPESTDARSQSQVLLIMSSCSIRRRPSAAALTGVQIHTPQVFLTTTSIVRTATSQLATTEFPQDIRYPKQPLSNPLPVLQPNNCTSCPLDPLCYPS